MTLISSASLESIQSISNGELTEEKEPLLEESEEDKDKEDKDKEKQP